MAGTDLTKARRIAGMIRADVVDRSIREEALVALDDEIARLTAGIEGIAGVLEAHGIGHMAEVGGKTWCTTCDQVIGACQATCAEDDALMYAHQAEAVAAHILGRSA